MTKKPAEVISLIGGLENSGKNFISFWVSRFFLALV